MTATSTIPNVLAGLVGPSGLFTQATTSTLAGVDVAYGVPRDIGRRSLIMPGATSEWDQDWATLQPAHPRNERYTLDLVIVAGDPGYSQQQATEQAFAILAAVENLLRPVDSLPTFTANQRLTDMQIAFQRTVGLPMEEGYEAEILAGVRIAARI